MHNKGRGNAVDFIAVGSLIKNLRKKQGISQEELASGIISREHLSKVESGRHNLPKEKLDLIFNRLGHAAQAFFPYLLTDRDFEAYELRIRFNNAQAAYNTPEMERLVRLMEAHPSFNSPPLLGAAYYGRACSATRPPCACGTTRRIIPRQRRCWMRRLSSRYRDLMYNPSLTTYSGL
jgi:transcriptional regulator with XRE-family HTH domain